MFPFFLLAGVPSISAGGNPDSVNSLSGMTNFRSVDRCQNDPLAAGATFRSVTHRKTASHDRAALVARLRRRLDAAACPSMFRQQSSCLLRVRFPFKHKNLLICSRPASLPDIPQRVLANSMPELIGRYIERKPTDGSVNSKDHTVQNLNGHGHKKRRSFIPVDIENI